MDKLKEIERGAKMKRFLIEKQPEVKLMNKTFTDLFTEIGKRYNDGGMQLAFTGTVILTFLKQTNVEKSVKKNMLKDALRLVKMGKA